MVARTLPRRRKNHAVAATRATATGPITRSGCSGTVMKRPIRKQMAPINSSTNGIEIWSGVKKGTLYEGYPGKYPVGFGVQK